MTAHTPAAKPSVAERRLLRRTVAMLDALNAVYGDKQLVGVQKLLADIAKHLRTLGASDGQ